jgi:hypothetical protein
MQKYFTALISEVQFAKYLTATTVNIDEETLFMLFIASLADIILFYFIYFIRTM